MRPPLLNLLAIWQGYFASDGGIKVRLPLKYAVIGELSNNVPFNVNSYCPPETATFMVPTVILVAGKVVTLPEGALDLIGL